MIKVEQSIDIDRPIEEVFDFIADQINAPRWQSGVLEVRRTTGGSIGIGTRYTFVRKLLGRRLEANNDCTECEPNKKIVFKGTSDPMDFQAGYLTQAASERGGTRLTSWIEVQNGAFAGLAEPPIESSLRRDVEASLAELKELLEARGGAPVTGRD